MEQELSVEELALEDKISLLVDALPRPIQNFLRGPQRNQVALALTQKYGLHADHAGVFERAYLYMLLGIFTPEEFTNELLTAGISKEAVQGLTVDINEQVFKKLRAEEQETPTIIPVRTEPMVPVMQVGTVTSPTSPTPVEPPAQSTPSINLIQGVTETPKVVPTFVPAPPQQTAPAAHEMLVHPRTMQQDMALAGHGGSAPANLPGVMQAAPVSIGQSSPARAFQTSSIPNTAHDTPQYVRPAAITPSTPLRDTFASMPAPAPKPADVPPPSTKEYRVDPYREIPQ